MPFSLAATVAVTSSTKLSPQRSLDLLIWSRLAERFSFGLVPLKRFFACLVQRTCQLRNYAGTSFQRAENFAAEEGSKFPALPAFSSSQRTSPKGRSTGAFGAWPQHFEFGLAGVVLLRLTV